VGTNLLLCKGCRKRTVDLDEFGDPENLCQSCLDWKMDLEHEANKDREDEERRGE